tara:strand:+ start:644 stop:778 length:135 start_codon:yes stop_codon:yes gene_type:complete
MKRVEMFHAGADASVFVNESQVEQMQNNGWTTDQPQPQEEIENG